MAILDIQFYSQALNRQVPYKVIIPIDGPISDEDTSLSDSNFRTLYLLHGMMGNNSDWLRNTNINQLAYDYNIAVVMPSGDNSFYIDHKASGNFYGEYIGRELVEETRKLLPLSTEKEGTFIAGLSMGGYGAIRNGLKYPHTFGAIAGMSSVTMSASFSFETLPWKRELYEGIFGNLDNLEGTENDLEMLVKNLSDSMDIPRMYISCGTEDYLIENNRRFRNFLVSEKINHKYEESQGGHDWIFWNTYLEKVFKWL